MTSLKLFTSFSLFYFHPIRLEISRISFNYPIVLVSLMGLHTHDTTEIEDTRSRFSSDKVLVLTHPCQETEKARFTSLKNSEG